MAIYIDARTLRAALRHDISGGLLHAAGAAAPEPLHSQQGKHSCPLITRIFTDLRGL
jgi:hypothetical protein